jgi:hypothetical protein
MLLMFRRRAAAGGAGVESCRPDDPVDGRAVSHPRVRPRPQTTGVLDLQAGSPIVSMLAELALFAVLFTDGMRVGWTDLRSAWRLPGRALAGLPLTLAIIALAVQFIVGLGSRIGRGQAGTPLRHGVPRRGRRLRGPSSRRSGPRTRPRGSHRYCRAVGCDPAGADPVLLRLDAVRAAQCDGDRPAGTCPGQDVALISFEFLGEISRQGRVFAPVALILARPLALATSFLRSGLGAREQLAAMWFGPKGFASVVYGLIVLESDMTAADEVFHLVALTIVLSILAHSSTDVVVARSFEGADLTPEPGRTG